MPIFVKFHLNFCLVGQTQLRAGPKMGIHYCIADQNVQFFPNDPFPYTYGTKLKSRKFVKSLRVNQQIINTLQNI